jgi:hypothetical protein
MSMLQQEESQKRDRAENMVDAMPFSMGDPVFAVAVGSVLYSWYHFYIKGDTDTGLFVGLWAPTLLTAASYIQQKDVVRKFKKGLASF